MDFAPRYFLIGYSKGGVALHFIAENRRFVDAHVDGLLTIASPLQGADIVNQSDLPIEIVRLLSSDPIPDGCQGENWAAKGLTPSALRSFWRKNGKNVLGATRYYSISFTQSAENSHLFMKATKQIARYKEPNDGIVPLSHSRFPEWLGATDLGILTADHLAGMVASRFPQKPFFEAIVLTLAELNAWDRVQNQRWNRVTHHDSSLLTLEDHQREVRALLYDSLKNSAGLQFLVQENLKRRADTVNPQVFDSFLSSYSLNGRTENSLSAVRDIFTNAMRGTPYAVKPFQLNPKGATAEFSFSTPKWRGLSSNSITRKTGTLEDLLNALLETRQEDGRNLLLQPAEAWRTYPESVRPPLKLTSNTLGDFDSEFRFSLKGMPDFFRKTGLSP